ncbi:MAG: DUF2341 domain-containing protein, partial [Verrucomicrobiota bacterium]|nr:DUF2341 domain-containing protein [Verrucomicrobiota bacterium]
MDDGSTDLVRDSRGSYHATPNNFDELYDEGVIGKALNFDGVNDYLDMSLGAHPPSGTEQLTISFWSKGGFDTLSNTTLFESGTSLGRNLNVHLPWGNSRIYWDAGSEGVWDGLNKEIAEYSGVWVHWVLQKDANLGIMRIYKNGVLFEEGFDRTRPMGAEVDAFKVGASRYQGNWWKGLLDEFRIGLFMESSDSILASYQSQNPSGAGSFASLSDVSGPPIILGGQLAEGYANDANRSFSYLIKTYPVADSFTVVGLPPGLDFNQSTGRISGVPLQGGSYQITVTADNAYGSDQGNVDLRFASLIGFSHSATFDFSGYDGNQTLLDFPTYLTLDSSIDNFSLKSFSSKEFHDLRFFDNQGRELNYEIDLIQPDSNQLTVWVQVKEMNASNTISAHWGNPNLADSVPLYSVDGSTWSNEYRGV